MELHLSLTATECHLPYGITQWYLPPDTSEHIRLHPSQTCRYSINLPRRDGRLSWPRNELAFISFVEPIGLGLASTIMLINGRILSIHRYWQIGKRVRKRPLAYYGSSIMPLCQATSRTKIIKRLSAEFNGSSCSVIGNADWNRCVEVASQTGLCIKLTIFIQFNSAHNSEHKSHQMTLTWAPAENFLGGRASSNIVHAL